MTDLASRLQKARKDAGFSSAKEAAERVGVTYDTYAQHENGTRGFRADRAEAYARAFKVDLQWLLTGKGTLSKSKNNADEPLDDEGEKVKVNHLDIRFGMGGGAHYDAPVESRPMSFSRAWLEQLTNSKPENLFWASGFGDSMYPTIGDRDLVLVDTSQKEPRIRDQIWALNQYGQGMIKRLRASEDGYLILSDNKEVPPDTASDGSMEIIGRVVAVIRRV